MCRDYVSTGGSNMAENQLGVNTEPTTYELSDTTAGQPSEDVAAEIAAGGHSGHLYRSPSEDVSPETCPGRESHGKPFRYCPVKGCGWHQEPCREQLRLFQGELGVVECVLPPGHEGKHETKVRWL